MKENFQKFVIHVSGDDHPGILQKVINIFLKWNTDIVDIQQITILEQLSLVFYIHIDEQQFNNARTEIEKLASTLNVQIVCKKTDDKFHHYDAKKYMLTILSYNIPTQVIYSIAQIMEKHAINIERINQIANQPIRCIEFFVEFFR